MAVPSNLLVPTGTRVPGGISDPEPPPSHAVPIEPVIPVSAPWRFILIESKNMERIDELSKASDPSVEVLLDLPGSCTFTYPMDADNSDKIKSYKTGIIAERFNWRETMARYNAGLYGQVWDKIWSGYVLPIKEDWKTGKMTVSCVGWLQRLAKRINRQKLVFTSMDDGDIVLALLQHLNDLSGSTAEHASGTVTAMMADGYEIHWPALSSPNTSTWIKYGGKQPNEGVGGATAYVPLTDASMGPAPRSITVENGTNILPIISSNLIETENGCDVVVNPVTRALTVHRKYRRIKDDVVIGFNWGPSNSSEFTRDIDGEQKVNYLLAKGAPGSTPQYADDLDDMDEVGPIEEVHSLGNVMNAETLLAFAGAELIVRKDGVITYGITPFAYQPGAGMPEPFVDFREGDQIQVKAKHPVRGSIFGGVRVFGLKVGFDNNRNERLGQLQVSP